MQNFETIAEIALQDLMTQFERRFDGDVDLDIQDGVMRAEFDSGEVYLINRHLPLSQIWLSSPKSGAWHFAPCPIGDKNILNFISTRGEKISIYDLLNQELKPAENFTPPAIRN